MGDTPCPFCGAISPPRSCATQDYEGVCPWEEGQPDPDILREDRDEMRRLAKEDPHVG